MAIAGDLINRALRLIGVLAEDETPSASISQDALAAMNQMIDSWSTERLAVFCTQEQIFTWPAGEIMRTLGPTGDFVGTRITKLEDATYYVSSFGMSHNVIIADSTQYGRVTAKVLMSDIPNVIFVNATVPNAELRLYPIPAENLEWHFISTMALQQPALLTTDLVLPPGYSRAFIYNLAMEIAPEFGVEPSGQVARIAMVSKRNIKRLNNLPQMLEMPHGMITHRPFRTREYE